MESLKDIILNKKHDIYRRTIGEINEQYCALDLSDEERVVRRFEWMCENETPVILPEQKIVFMRTVRNLPDCFTAAEWEEKRKHHYIHETGYVSNLLPDYETAIHSGLLALKETGSHFVHREIDALLDLCDRYLEHAVEIGRDDVVSMLKHIPRHGARSFKEALQFFRILHYALLLEGGYQIVAGRIDQFLYPYFIHDYNHGILTEEEALELIQDFFLSFNIDSDLYDGVQQGDNGQSVVLGGVDEEGNDCFNLLSKLCLEASRRNKVIDPKINLRVSKNTSLEIFELGSRLTKEGLGFPQYLNDDVIIEGLIQKGYDIKDARNYAVAACWEIIIPKYGFEVVNIGACSFPKVLENTVNRFFNCESFEELKKAFCIELNNECDRITSEFKDVYFVPAPLTESLHEIKYRNFGIHGTGLATAADSLAAIQKIVFEQKRMTLREFNEARINNFEQNVKLNHELRFNMPKMGQNQPCVDSFACWILDEFCNSLENRTNCWNGTYRAGTGTAMFYLDHAKEIGASFDGRKKDEPFSANYSPSLFAKINGPFSIIESFTKPDLVRAMNGGPLTLEFSSSMFNDDESIQKTARFVQLFICKGGHQLQCNSVNLEQLKDAQYSPEKYRNLIVRIWGWSAYFVELDKDFQNHVIARQEYSL